MPNMPEPLKSLGIPDVQQINIVLMGLSRGACNWAFCSDKSKLNYNKILESDTAMSKVEVIQKD